MFFSKNASLRLAFLAYRPTAFTSSALLGAEASAEVLPVEDALPLGETVVVSFSFFADM
jgi:hypothetical protein